MTGETSLGSQSGEATQRATSDDVPVPKRSRMDDPQGPPAAESPSSSASPLQFKVPHPHRETMAYHSERIHRLPAHTHVVVTSTNTIGICSPATPPNALCPCRQSRANRHGSGMYAEWAHRHSPGRTVLRRTLLDALHWEHSRAASWLMRASIRHVHDSHCVHGGDAQVAGGRRGCMGSSVL